MPTTSPPTVAVVDYGAGNLRSVAKALERSGLRPVVTGDPDALASCAGIVLPGVGAFPDAMAELQRRGLDEALAAAVDRGVFYLGLCLGLQLLFDESDEHGVHPGLGWLPGRVERFADQAAGGERLCVPHIGWNEVRFEGDHPVVSRLPERDHYYFVHSYRAVAAGSDCVVGWTDYGGAFAAAVARDNVLAVQFHPEKSQQAGRRLLDGFRDWIEAS
ncbi:MAG: imidazole glycerol phosphate synthase subunit HisH [Myxococcota bacterium]